MSNLISTAEAAKNTEQPIKNKPKMKTSTMGVCHDMKENQIDITSETRVEMAEGFFNLLYGNVTECKFGYLWTRQDKTTYPFDVSTADNRRAMAQKAIELNDTGKDIYYSVNLGDESPNGDKRHKANKISMQTATVADIDIRSEAHKGDLDKFPPDFNTAKALLPFEASILVDSGYGIHSLNLYEEPIIINDDNRDACEKRNEKFLNVIRDRAGIYSKAVDSVGDLPRILRCPGTYNYKLGKDNAPLCRCVEVNDARFTPASMDERLNALKTARTVEEKQDINGKSRSTQRKFPEDKDYDRYRARRMLDFISPSSLTYDDWYSVGMALKNIGCDCSDWEQWSRADERFKDGECEFKWSTFNRDGLGIGTLSLFAQSGGYDEKTTRDEYYLSARRTNKSSPMNADKTPEEIVARIRNACEWNYRKDKEGNLYKTTIKPTTANFDKIFDEDPNIAGLFGFDEFKGEAVFLKKAIWNRDFEAGDKFTDKDAAQLRMYLRRAYADLQHDKLLADKIIEFAHANSFNPVKDFYKLLPEWDGTPRAETFFVKFLGAEDTPYTREATFKWLLGAIARVFHPGCDFQWALVTQGAQRIGKSKSVKMLAGKEGVNPNGYSWHVALKDSVDDAHAVDALQHGGIIEIEEFSAARRAEINALKSFISANEDTRRFAYDRNTSTRKRHCVFVVTCNDQQFLRDPTGNARFWIIKCSQKKFSRVEGMTPEYIRQVWAEVYHHYNEIFKDGFDEAKLRPTEQLEIKAEEIAEKYLQDDGMAQEIKAYLDKKIPPQVIWKLCNKEVRRNFFTYGFVAFDLTTLNNLRRSKGGSQRSIEDDIAAIYALINTKMEKYNVQKIPTGTNEPVYHFFGAELRKHICAVEILNECFANGDRRKNIHRVNEILTSLDDWTIGARLQKTDPEYRDQRTVYYRIETANTEENEEESNTPDEFNGKYIDTDEIPF